MSNISKPEFANKLKKLENLDDANKRLRDSKYPEMENCFYPSFLINIRWFLKEKAKEFGN